MNIKLIKCEIKWFIKLKILQKIKKYIWCYFICGKKNRCYPRVDIPQGEPGSEYWHCCKCYPCGICFDYLEEKIKAQGEYDKTI